MPLLRAPLNSATIFVYDESISFPVRSSLVFSSNLAVSLTSSTISFILLKSNPTRIVCCGKLIKFLPNSLPFLGSGDPICPISLDPPFGGRGIPDKPHCPSVKTA